MSNITEQFVPEPERYEIISGPIHHFELAQRAFGDRGHRASAL